jgi:hypothetical protein
VLYRTSEGTMMKFKANALFEEVIPHMPEKLVSPEVMSLFKKLLEKFPEELTSDGLFECPLGTDNPLSDLSLFVNETGREIIAGTREGAELEQSLLRSPVWKRIRSFCAKWFFQEICQNKGTMWLEFDRESLRKEIPLPGIFFNARISQERDFSSHRVNACTCIIEGLECLRGRPLKKEIRENLIHCLGALPDKGSLDFAALMLSRPLDAVRVVIRIPEGELKDYLSCISYPGDSQHVLDLVTELSQFTHLRYNLDISHKVMARIGIECFLRDKKKAHKERWEQFLIHLAGRSLCVTEKKDALMDWIGHTRVTLPQDPEPYYIFRRICHIKVVYEKDKPLLAKAYPEFFGIPHMDLILHRLVESCNTE